MLVGKCYAANLFLISPVMSFTMTELRDGLVAERMSGYGIASTSGNYCIYWSRVIYSPTGGGWFLAYLHVIYNSENVLI